MLDSRWLTKGGFYRGTPGLRIGLEAIRQADTSTSGWSMPLHHPAGAVGPEGAAQRGSGARARDPVARRHRAPGQGATGVHAAAGRAGAPAPRLQPTRLVFA